LIPFSFKDLNGILETSIIMEEICFDNEREEKKKNDKSEIKIVSPKYLRNKDLDDIMLD
jgi:hypothetical protein